MIRRRLIVAALSALLFVPVGLWSTAAHAAPASPVSSAPASLGAAAAGGFVGVTPSRLLDTREGNGAPQAPVGPGGSIDLQVTGRGGVPAADVAAVVLNVTAIGPSESGFVTAWPTGEPRPTASNLNFVAGQTVPNLVIVKVGAGGMVSLFNLAGTVNLAADVSGYYTTASQLVPVTPTRLLDTRSGLGGVQGPTSGSVDVQAVGQAGIPLGATSVVLNVTVDQPTSGGYLTVWPTGFNRPDASNLNFVAGQAVPNLVIVKIGTEGKISYFNNSGRLHVIMDVLGYTSTASDLTELFDSVATSGGDATTGTGYWDAGTAHLNGRNTLNTVWDNKICSESTPSWVEYNLGRQWATLSTTFAFDDFVTTSTSRVRFRILGDGNVLADQTLSFGETSNVVVDVTGVLRVRFDVLDLNPSGCSTYPLFVTPRLSAAANAGFPADPEYSPLVPKRILDTRSGVGAAKGRVPGGGTIDLQVLGQGGVPASGVGAVVMNLTVTDPDVSGYLTAYPSGQPLPTASNVNFVGGQTVPNLVIVPVGPNGRVSIYNFGGPAHVLADVLGWYAGGSDVRPSAVDLTEALDYVFTSGGDGTTGTGYWDEGTVHVDGQPRFNSLWDNRICSESTPSWFEYNLGRQWGALATTLAFDDGSSTSVSRVRFRILGDGNVLTEQTLSFGQTSDVTVDVTGVLRLRFDVLDANTGTGCSSYPVFATPHLSR